jgi:hypothetical protein
MGNYQPRQAGQVNCLSYKTVVIHIHLLELLASSKKYEIDFFAKSLLEFQASK